MQATMKLEHKERHLMDSKGTHLEKGGGDVGPLSKVGLMDYSKHFQSSEIY